MQNKGALVLAAAGGAIALAAQTKREDAMSNLSTWIPSLGSVPNADLIATLIGTILFLIAAYIYFRPNPKPERGGVAIEPSTNGSYSPAVVGDGNIFHINSPVPPSAQPTTPPAERVENYKSYVDGLSRAIGAAAFRENGDRPPMAANPLGLARYIKPEPKPDIAIVGLLGRIYKKCGKLPKDGRLKAAFYKRVDREIADAVVLNRLSVWGYYMDTPIRAINFHAWQNAILDHRKRTLSIPTDTARPMIIRDLRFNKEETDAIWPPE